ncbi:hypothetical protein BR93DRAFT_908647 [Coniochaeta sp. PMI_546]|nr:hypothetical protein BR93DRAFT_908647 [Coniochaeta sp. PMI_546]
MALSAPEEQYFVYENRLASFQGPQPVAKRRASNASSRAPKALNWPHKKLSPSSFAQAGFVFQPTPANPDNVVCFLCGKHLDGWEEDDDPLVEHLKHVPDCGWAIVAAIEKELGDFAKVHPLDPRMIEARKATFAGKWPYDAKKSWKCKTKQLVEAGWYYNPTLDSDDMATCAYCQLALDGWEASDKPMDEHYKRSPECPFFELINQNPAPKKSRSTKAARASKASRLSMQSVATTMSDMQSMAGDMTLDPDVSVMTTTSVATQGGKKGRPRKAAAAKTRKTKATKDEAIEILEDAQDREVPPPPPPKPARGRKRGSEEVEDSIVMNVDEAPAPKRRATRGKIGEAIIDNLASVADAQDTAMADGPVPPAKQPAGRKKGRASNAKTTARKVSAPSLKAKASTASLRAQAALDDDLERQLQADLERPLTEDEYMTADSETERGTAAPPVAKTNSKQAASSRKATARSHEEQHEDYAMFDPAPVAVDDAQVEEELKALQSEMKVEQEQLEVPKKGRKAGTRKASKQTKKVKEPEVPAPPPEPVDEPEEDSIVVGRMPVVAPEPTAAIEDPDTDSGTVVNKTSTSQPAAARPRGRPKKNSTSSQAAAKKAELEPVDSATQPQPDNLVVDNETDVRDSISVIQPSAAVTSHPLTSTARPQSGRNINKSLPPAPPSPPPPSEKPAPPLAPPATPRTKHTAPSASAKQATLSPSQSPQSSDAENQPPSSKPASSAAAKRVVLAPISLPPTTPGRNLNASPSRRNVVAGLRSTQPWKPVDLDLVFALVGEGEGEADVDSLLKRGGAELSTPERNMTVEEWIFYNAGLAEQMLKAECEGMVNKFEVEGGKAMRVLEGLVVE